MSDQVWWYATRAAGMMTWATATASIVLGLLLSTKRFRAKTGPWFLDLHRFLGGITVVFLVAHMVTLWLDSYVEFGVKDLFIPGQSGWKPEAIAWGIIAAYMLIAVEVSSLLRSRMPNAVWRAIHFTSFAAMIAGSYHAYLAGSDVDNPVTWAIAGIGCVLTFGLISLRLQRNDPEDPETAGFGDNRAILEEMRRRLEELPIPESTPQPQIAVSPAGSLPRRAPVSPGLPGISETVDDDSIAEPVGFADDPFAAMPLAGDEPELGDWAEPSPADPFPAGGVDPFRKTTTGNDSTLASPTENGRFRSRPFTDRTAWEDDGADLFADLVPADDEPGLFEQFGSHVADAPDAPGTPLPRRTRDPLADIAPMTEPTPATDLFAAAMPADPFADLSGNPFDPVDPTPTAIHTPVDTPAPGGLAAGPPPLPEGAVDPVTGEPDEAAYSQWLKDWLAYAEQYGDEAPGDPNRI